MACEYDSPEQHTSRAETYAARHEIESGARHTPDVRRHDTLVLPCRAPRQ